MQPTQLTHRRRSLRGLGTVWPGIPDSWWPFPVTETPLPQDPIACMQQWPITTWDIQNSKCVRTNGAESPPTSGGSVDSSTLYGLMKAACQAASPSCAWDDKGMTCVCGDTSSLAPQADGTTSACPAGSTSMPVPSIPGAEGYNLPTQVCVPVSGSNIPAIPNLNIPNVPPIPTAPGQQTGQPVKEQPTGWWAQQSDGVKMAVIGGGAVVGLGLIFLMVKAAQPAPRYGY